MHDDDRDEKANSCTRYLMEQVVDIMIISRASEAISASTAS
jgi:hypothetical protein